MCPGPGGSVKVHQQLAFIQLIVDAFLLGEFFEFSKRHLVVVLIG
jgi:hypothetical protein